MLKHTHILYSLNPRNLQIKASQDPAGDSGGPSGGGLSYREILRWQEVEWLPFLEPVLQIPSDPNI